MCFLKGHTLLHTCLAKLYPSPKGEPKPCMFPEPSLMQPSRGTALPPSPYYTSVTLSSLESPFAPRSSPPSTVHSLDPHHCPLLHYPDKQPAQGHPGGGARPGQEAQGWLMSNLKHIALRALFISLPHTILTSFHFVLGFTFAVQFQIYRKEGKGREQGRTYGHTQDEGREGWTCLCGLTRRAGLEASCHPQVMPQFD